MRIKRHLLAIPPRERYDELITGGIYIAIYNITIFEDRKRIFIYATRIV